MQAAWRSDSLGARALPFDTARAEILRMAGSQFDPGAVDTFLREEAALRGMAAMELSPAK